jgi:hypothetical protein
MSGAVRKRKNVQHESDLKPEEIDETTKKLE